MRSATNTLRISRGGWVVRVLGLVFVVTGLMAVSVVDVDGDPTTTNVATVVLGGEVPVAPEDSARRTLSGTTAPVDVKPFTRFRLAVGRWLGEGRYRWTARIRPIRGP